MAIRKKIATVAATAGALIGGWLWHKQPAPTATISAPPACTNQGKVWCFQSTREVGGWISLAVPSANVSAVWQNSKQLTPTTDYAVATREGNVMVDVLAPRLTTAPEMFRVVMQ